MSLETPTEARCCQQDLQVRSAAYPRGAVVIIVVIIIVVIIIVIITIIVTIVIIALIIVLFVIIVLIIVVIIVISLKKGAWAPKLVGPNVGLGLIPDPQQ